MQLLVSQDTSIGNFWFHLHWIFYNLRLEFLARYPWAGLPTQQHAILTTKVWQNKKNQFFSPVNSPDVKLQNANFSHDNG